ncbi:MAG: glycosyltransferase, partial [Chitinophagaceae bacterium]|nr:glycosyltransferase [Chitinophagaceae bacterium]
MLISILVANYNNSRYLENAISSVYAQTYSNWEIILIDDGSKDEFEEVIKRYSNDARIKVFRNGKNIGCASTKKNCIERSSGEVLAFLDPDDSLAPEAL